MTEQLKGFPTESSHTEMEVTLKSYNLPAIQLALTIQLFTMPKFPYICLVYINQPRRFSTDNSTSCGRRDMIFRREYLDGVLSTISIRAKTRA